MKETKRNAKSPVARVKHHLKSVVVPHKSNNFKPHAIRWYGLAVIIAVTTFAVGSSTHWNGGGSVLGVQATITSTSLLNDTNAERQKDNEEPLRYNEQLSTAAYMKAEDMFKQQYWAHVAPDGTTPWAWFAKVGYDYAYAGENLAKNFPTASATTAAWMASPTHKANILDMHYTDVGFAVMDGVLGGKQTTLIVALYGQPVAAVAGATTTSTPSENAAVGDENLSLMARLGVAFQSMAPAVLGSIIVLLVVAFIALVAHTYRRQLPKALRKSWRYHHGAYKAAGLMSLVIAIVALYSGGQI